jgi:hypothetical protein
MNSLQRWGYPLSEAQQMVLEDGSEVIAQWFERGRFELHAESSPPQIMVTRLGALFPTVAAGTSVLEQLNAQLNAHTLSQQFAAQFMPSPILDLRMNNDKHALEQVYYLYIDRLEKQLYNNYLAQVLTTVGSDGKCIIDDGNGTQTDFTISYCVYQLLTNPNFVVYKNASSYFYFLGSIDTRDIYLESLSLGDLPYNIPNATFLEKFAIHECGLQGYTNLADYAFQNDSSFTYDPPNDVSVQICDWLRAAMSLAGVSELRLVKSSLSTLTLNGFLLQSLFASGNPRTVTDIAYIKEPPSMVVNPAAMLTTAATIGMGQTFPVTATMSLFWDSDVYVSRPSALDKMHVTVHASEFANFDDAYQWYRYRRWVEPYIYITDDDIQTDSNNRLPQMTRVGTGLYEWRYTAYQHLLRNNRSYYIVVTGHNQLATWALADRIALLIDTHEPLTMGMGP